MAITLAPTQNNLYPSGNSTVRQRMPRWELLEGIRAEDLDATYHDGVLKLTDPMPKPSIAPLN